MSASGALTGPWSCAFWLEIDAVARSKSNFRRRSRSAEWSSLSGFEQQLAMVTQAHTPSGWELGQPPPAALASRPDVVAAVFAPTLLDAGNLSKSVFDALEGVLYHNDASVRMVTTGVLARRREPGLLLLAAQLPPRSSVEVQLDALQGLLLACRPLVAQRN